MNSRLSGLCATLLLVNGLLGAQWVSAQNAAPAEEAAAEPAAAEHDPVDDLAWVIGPGSAKVGSNATMQIPEGYRFLGARETAKLMEMMQNPSSDSEYTFAPHDLSWFALIDFDDMGYVKDDEKIDADALLKSMTEGTEAANEDRRSRGWPEMHIVGWRYQPRYDEETKRLEWAIDGKSGDDIITNFNTRILGRRGVASVTLVEAPENLEATVPVFKELLQGYAFNEGERYAEFVPGDKVAEYGLAALVAGGAAAAAAKTGIFKALWKFLVVGAIAVAGGLRKFFGRKDTAEA